ncbi:MAG: hypothetical protein J6T06_09940 [Victivallales bacterium]|nr:hypothetical protein [Victivallales bacterium]
MLSDENYIMHLTPHGWVNGTEKTAGGMVERPVPSDAVFSLIFHEMVRGLLSQKEQWLEVEYRIDRSSDMLKILFSTYGKLPDRFQSWKIKVNW